MVSTDTPIILAENGMLLMSVLVMVLILSVYSVLLTNGSIKPMSVP